MKQTKIKSQTFIIRKGLSWEQAVKVARTKATRDYRGCSYNPKTGKLILT